MALRWIIDKVGGFLPFGRRKRSARTLNPADEEDSLLYVLQDPVEEAKARSLISVLGVMPANLREILDAAVEACRANGEFPVVVLSELRPDLTAASSAPLEFLPTRGYLPSLSPEIYGRYARRRWSLILAKWDISSEIALSSTIDEFLADQVGADASLSSTASNRGMQRTVSADTEDKLLDRIRSHGGAIDVTNASQSPANLGAESVR
ncbi:hypothetical protein EV130_106253 [Rhizobium azibense]|uniref:Uncharacterized protein n=1 Tax=Rhizobium azibense TaxID=1136135 RepID=A0A4R3QQX7_9HYPH|nr:hypothetical protein EV130_106253 [Rhizobium azibense]TCU39406.1 hypothetical protein EV129_103253 [Rhizobium azibense]